MVEAEFNAYFEDIAKRLKAIGHNPEKEIIRFALSEELINGLRNAYDADGFLLAVMHEQGSIANIGIQHGLKEYHQCSFFVLRQTATEDYEAIEEAWTACFEIGRKVLSKMVHDYEHAHTMMALLDVDSVKFAKVGPIADHHYGYEFSFILLKKAGCNYRFDPNDWL